MKTYQDFEEAVQAGEESKVAFIESLINYHRSTAGYKMAVDAELYYQGENPTINKYEKIIYDMKGRAHVNMWTANHKIASQFFGMAIRQEASYLLGNGVTFSKDGTKEKLETAQEPFDVNLMNMAIYALVDGVCYGFWNLDHIEVFRLTEFAALLDEEDGSIKAGVRFWQLEDGKPLRATLYEMDGYTEYIRRNGERMQELVPKRAYIVHTVGSAYDRAHGTTIYRYDNYPGFPIVPLKNGDKMRSELKGKRNTLDAYDLILSNMVNNVDEGNLIYWVLTNCGGMDDLDDARFLEQLHITHVVHADGDAAGGATAEPHSIEAPIEGTQTAADSLKRQLYEDFQAFDSSAVTAGQQTATAIQASYVPLDLKTDFLEMNVVKFIGGILELAGIDDKPTFTRNKIVNRQEEAQTVILGAQYFDDEYITRKLLTILGDADQADEILKRMAADQIMRQPISKNPQEGQTAGEEQAQEQPQAQQV